MKHQGVKYGLIGAIYQALSNWIHQSQVRASNKICFMYVKVLFTMAFGLFSI